MSNKHVGRWVLKVAIAVVVCAALVCGTVPLIVAFADIAPNESAVKAAASGMTVHAASAKNAKAQKAYKLYILKHKDRYYDFFYNYRFADVNKDGISEMLLIRYASMSQPVILTYYKGKVKRVFSGEGGWIRINSKKKVFILEAVSNANPPINYSYYFYKIIKGKKKIVAKETGMMTGDDYTNLRAGRYDIRAVVYGKKYTQKKARAYTNRLYNRSREIKFKALDAAIDKWDKQM